MSIHSEWKAISPPSRRSRKSSHLHRDNVGHPDHGSLAAFANSYSEMSGSIVLTMKGVSDNAAKCPSPLEHFNPRPIYQRTGQNSVGKQDVEATYEFARAILSYA